MRALIVALAVCVFPHAARADEAKDRIAAARAMLTAQTTSLAKGDDKAFAATLTDDAKTSRGNGDELGGKDSNFELTIGFTKKIAIASSKIGWAGTWGWIAADLRVTWKMYAEPEGAGNPNPKPQTDTMHWIAVFVPDGKGVKTRFVAALDAKKGADHTDYNYVQDLKPVAAPPASAALLVQPKTLVTKLGKDAEVSVFGSSPGENGLGPAAAKKLLTSWSRLTMEVVEDPNDKQGYKIEELAMGDAKVVRATLRFAPPTKNPRWTLLHGFAVLRKAGSEWDVVTVAYGP